MINNLIGWILYCKYKNIGSNPISLKYNMVEPIISRLVIGITLITLIGLVTVAFLHYNRQIALVYFIGIIFLQAPLAINSYPIFAQQIYRNPVEKTRQIVCANCHLAQKPFYMQIPHSTFANSYFNIILEVPSNNSILQILANRRLRGLNAGAVILLPERFTLALNTRNNNSLFTPYKKLNTQIFVIRPQISKLYQRTLLTIITRNLNLFAKLVLIGRRNRGRRQVYPNRNRSNNNTFFSAFKSFVLLKYRLARNRQIYVRSALYQIVPLRPLSKVYPGQRLQNNEILTFNINIRGFRQTEEEITLQNPQNLFQLILLLSSTLLAQLSLVLKKKQFERCFY